MVVVSKLTLFLEQMKYIFDPDEVGALVFDVGHHSFRAGYAGEDSPKAEIPSQVGVVTELVENCLMEVDGQTPSSDKKYFIDTVSVNVPRKGMEMTSFLKDGMGTFSFSFPFYSFPFPFFSFHFLSFTHLVF